MYIDIDNIKVKLRHPSLGLNKLRLEEMLKYFEETSLGHGCRNKEIGDWEIDKRYEHLGSYSEIILRKSKLEKKVLNEDNVSGIYKTYLKKSIHHVKKGILRNSDESVYETLKNFSDIFDILNIQKAQQVLELEKKLLGKTYEDSEDLVSKTRRKGKRFLNRLNSFFSDYIVPVANPRNLEVIATTGLFLANLFAPSKVNPIVDMKDIKYPVVNQTKISLEPKILQPSWKIKREIVPKKIILDGRKYNNLAEFKEEQNIDKNLFEQLHSVIGNSYEKDDKFSIFYNDDEILAIFLENQKFRKDGEIEPLVTYLNSFYFSDNSFAQLGKILGWDNNLLKSFYRLFQVEGRYKINLTDIVYNSLKTLNGIDTIATTAIQEITSDSRRGHLIKDSWADARGLLQVTKPAVNHLKKEGFINYSWKDILAKEKEYEKNHRVEDFEIYQKMLLEAGIKFKLQIASKESKRLHKNRHLSKISEEVLSDSIYLGAAHVFKKIFSENLYPKNTDDFSALYKGTYPVDAVRWYVKTGETIRDAFAQLKDELNLDNAYPRLQKDYRQVLGLFEEEKIPSFIFEHDMNYNIGTLKEIASDTDDERVVKVFMDYSKNQIFNSKD